MICASPDYLARRSTLALPSNLAQHDCVAFSPGAVTQWRLSHGKGVCRVPVSRRIKVNNGQALRVAALHGLGIVLQPAILLEADVTAGRLVQVLAE